MTVAATLTQVQYTGNGSATQFSFNNKIFAASDLVVTIYDLSGNQYTFANQNNILLGSYTVQNVDVDTGCLVVFATPPPLNWTIDIRTSTAATQSTSIKNQGAFLPELHEEAFDRLTRIEQDNFRRAYTFSIHGPDNELTPWPALPGPAARKGFAVVFDPVSGLPVLGTPVAGTLTGTIIAQLLNPVTTVAPIGDRLQTAAETTGGVTPVNYNYAPLNLLRYGADSTGVTPSDAAMTAAIAVCGTAGGTIRVPAGTYLFNSSINLDSKLSIFIEGDGGANAGATTPTVLNFSSAGSGNFIFAGSSSGCGLRKLAIFPTQAGFSGTLVALGHGVSASDANFFTMLDCTVGTIANVSCTHLNLDKSLGCTFERINFNGGAPSVKGQASSGLSYSNAMTFKLCQWVGPTQNPVAYGGEAWEFDTCVFEGLANGNAGAFGTISATRCQGVTFRNCWMSDIGIGTPGTWITFFGQGLNVIGCFLGNSSAGESISINNTQGVAILGNFFFGALVAIGFDTATCGGVVIAGNDFKSVTTIFGGPATPANVVFNPNTIDSSPGIAIPPPAAAGVGNFATNGYEVSPNGTVDMWGSVSVTVGSPVIITFLSNNGIAFPTACWNIICSCQAPSTGTNVAATTSLSRTGVTLNVNGTGSATVMWRAKGN